MAERRIKGKAVAERPDRGRRKVAIATRYERLLDGELTLDDLDDDEIFRMQLRDRNGHFTGRPPKFIPRELAQAWAQEQQKRAVTWFQQQMPEAQKAHLELLRSKRLMPGDAARLKAVEMVYDRVIGKVGTETHITVDKGKSFEDFVDEAVIDVEVEDA